MRVPGSAGVLEARRRRALTLVRQGLSLNAAARRIGCAASSVMRWVRAFRQQGRAGLKVRSAPGRPPRLTTRQRQGLLQQLLRGPMAHGYPTQLWTTQRIAEVIERRYGVRYHRNHVSRLLAQCGWSCQKPARRARERDEQAIARWKRNAWPRVKKTPFGWGPTSPS
jgi:transposase